MNKITKSFIIFIAAFFIVTTLLVAFSGHGYELKGTKSPVREQSETQSAEGTDAQFRPYMEEMHKQISAKWQPPEATKDAEVVLEFTIMKNGEVKNAKIAQSSGNPKIDESALTALKKASPLPPLPMSYTNDSVNAKFNFSVHPAK